MSLNLALAYHGGDRDQTIRWMEWVKELGGLGDHKLYTISAFDCEPVPDILPNTRLDDSEKLTGDWQSTSPARSAAAPNSMFRTFAWHFFMEKLGPWMFIEPDCVPLTSDWLYKLEAEYLIHQKPFMGAHVQIEKVPEHLSGNAIYPVNVPQIGTTLIMRTNWINDGREYELAFDVAGARDTLGQSHFTNLIQHIFRHPGFKSREEFEKTIDKRAVLFHSCKDGSIFKYLKGGDATSTNTVAANIHSTSDTKPIAPRLVSNVAPTVQPAGATFPQEALRLAQELAALAVDAYHRRKVRDALKKVSLIQ